MKLQLSIFNQHAQKISLQDIDRVAEKVWRRESKRDGVINIVLVDDDKIKDLNKRYLNKNRVTDVIAFPISDEDNLFEGEIYISMDRVLENARIYKVDSSNELQRMVVHGMLHFLGYDDKASFEKEKMTNRENYYLSG
ncbi:MAG: rRNA maturation RNase YbeY [bacterium]